MGMTAQSSTWMRCERCRAVISNAEAADMIRHGVPCGVCGGPLTLCNGQRRSDAAPEATASASAERRLLGVLRDAEGAPVAPGMLAQAGINDPANAIFELERAGHCIERAYDEDAPGRRRFLGYRLGGADRQASGSQPSSSR